MRKVKAYRWMREHTLRGMDWECLLTYLRGRGLETTINETGIHLSSQTR